MPPISSGDPTTVVRRREGKLVVSLSGGMAVSEAERASWERGLSQREGGELCSRQRVEDRARESGCVNFFHGFQGSTIKYVVNFGSLGLHH